MGLALDTGNWVPLLGPDVARTLWNIANEPYCSEPIRQELLDTIHHYKVWSQVFSDVIERVLVDDNHLRMAISDLEHGVSDDRHNTCVLEDIKCLKEIISVCGLKHVLEVQYADLIMVT